MKKRALGSFCITNIICSIIVCLFFIIMIVFNFAILKDDGILYTYVYIICIFIVLQRFFRVIGCYYELNKDLLTMNYITIKKRTKWYDFMAIGRKLSFSYQKEYKEISYKDIEYIDFIKDKKINIAFWNKKEVAIKLYNGKYVWIVRNVFGKKQLREIINYIQDKNSKVGISDTLRDYINLT